MTEITSKSRYNRVWLTETNELTLGIVKLCKSLFDYGLYISRDNIKLILKPFIYFLNASQDVSSELEEKSKRGGTGTTSYISRVRSSDEQFATAQDEKTMPVFENRFT